MPDILDDFNKILKKDVVPILTKYFGNLNNTTSDNINDFIDDSRILLTNIFEKFSKNKENVINKENYSDIQNLTDMDQSFHDEYDDLLSRLILIEKNMNQIEKILKDKN